MVDPLAELFGGRSARSLVGSGEVLVVRGPRERLPAWTRTGPLADLTALCAAHAGPIDVAGGGRETGHQGPVAGLSPAAALAMGLSVMFHHLDRTAPLAGPWCREVERALGAAPGAVGVLAFANAPGSGLAVHHDAHDQIVIQLAGSKRFHWAPRTTAHATIGAGPDNPAWWTFGANYHAALPPRPADLAARLRTVALEPGAALFLPAGTWHATADQADECLSITVMLRSPSTAELLCSYLQEYLEQSPRWRARPWGAWGGDGPDLDAALDELRSHLEVLSADAAPAAWALRAFATRAQPWWPEGPWVRYVRLPNARIGVEVSGDEVDVVVRRGATRVPESEVRLRAPRRAADVVAWIAATERAFGVDELAAAFPDLPADAVASVLDQLGRAGWIRPIAVPELAEPDGDGR